MVKMKIQKVGKRQEVLNGDRDLHLEMSPMLNRGNRGELMIHSERKCEDKRGRLV